MHSWEPNWRGFFFFFAGFVCNPVKKRTNGLTENTTLWAEVTNGKFFLQSNAQFGQLLYIASLWWQTQRKCPDTWTILHFEDQSKEVSRSDILYVMCRMQ